MSVPRPDAKVQQSIDNLARALARLGEALGEPVTGALVIDGTIQRFEFTIELFWKTLRRCLEVEGVVTATPRESLSRAFQAGWLEDELAWLGMLRDRNQTSHTYDEDQARTIYDHIRGYYEPMTRALAVLRTRFPRAK